MTTDYRQVARQYAERYGIDPDLFERQIGAESNFNPRAGSPAGAQGIAQIMPTTAKGWGVDPHDPVASLDAAAKAMSKYVKQYGSYRNALVAYNAGPGRVGKPLYGETAKYIQKIMGGAADKHAAAPAAAAGGGYGLTSASPAEFTPSTGYSKLFAGGSKGDEWFGGFLDHSISGARARQAETSVAPAAVAAPGGGHAAPVIQGGAGSDYKGIIALGSKFGLKIQGDFQTTGGKHSAHSLHYAGKAVDFGDANNSQAEMLAFANYAKANPGQFKELFFNPLGWGIKNGKIIKGLKVAGHDDHLHAAVF